jgi:hypothetical protein
MAQLTITGLRARRLKVKRHHDEIERRRAKYIRMADNLSSAIDADRSELEKLDAAIAALSAYETHMGTRQPRTRGPRAKRNAAVDDAIIAEITKAGREGIAKDDLYDRLEAAGLPLMARKSFAVHLSYMSHRNGKMGPIVARNARWMLRDHAPPLPPPAIDEAERIIAERGAATRREIEAELTARAVPFTQKSLQTQLSERLRRGALSISDGRYSTGPGDLERLRNGAPSLP